MPLTHDQVLQFVRENGPCVPNEIRQALKAQDNFIVGAVLSELVAKGQVAMSDMNLGTSKFYYDPEHPESLERVSQHLNEKDLRTYQMLKSEQVLRHSEVTPLLRLSLSNIKDYSRPLRVRTDDGEELFWRYYLLPDEEAFELVKQRFFNEPQKTEQQPAAAENAVLEANADAQVEQPPPRRESKPKPERKPSQQNQSRQEKTGNEPPSLAEGFAKQVHEYFDEKQISLLQVVLNKKTELSMVISMPTPVGAVKYFCKAKSKKTTNDGDLAAAHLEAQQHRLPLLFVAGGKLTKKALAAQEQLPGVVVVQPWA